MKTFWTVLLFIPLFLTSCTVEETEEQENITYLTLSMSRDRMVTISQSTSENNTFSYYATISAGSPEIAPYSSQIKSLEIVELKFKVLDFMGDASGTINGYLKFDGTIIHTFTNQNVKLLNDNATEIIITDTQTLNNIAVKLKQNQEVNIEFAGVGNNPNDAMNFNLKMITKLKIGL